MEPKDYSITFTATTDTTEEELVTLVIQALSSYGVPHGPILSRRRGIRGRRKKVTVSPTVVE